MIKEVYLNLAAKEKKIVSDATCTEILNRDNIPVPGSLVRYPHREKAVALRLGLGNNVTMANVMFKEISNNIKNYNFALWPVNSRFRSQTLNGVQTIIVTSEASLLAELEITDDAHLISYNEIMADATLTDILNNQPTITYNASFAFGLNNSNWLPVYRIDLAGSLKVIPLDQRVVISTGKVLSESLKGQSPLMICI